MYASDCIAFNQADISVASVDLAEGSDLPRLTIKRTGNEIGITMSREQLELLLDSAEMWLFKQDELPRAREIINPAVAADESLRETA